MDIFIFVHTANLIFHKLKHQFGVFSQSLKVSGRPQTAFPSLKAQSETLASEGASGYLW